MGSYIAGAFQAVAGIIRRTAQSAGVYLGLVPSYLANLLWLIDRKFIALAQEAYGQNAAVYAVLHVLAAAVAEPPLMAHLEDDEGQLTPLPRQHELNRLIRNPTPGLLTQYELWELIVVYLGCVGRFNGFIERNLLGQPIGIWPLRPDRVGPIYSTLEQADQRVVKGWSYLIPGTTQYVAIPREDVWTINLPDPAGESGGLVEGLGPLQVLASEVSADNAATLMVGGWLKNNGTPSMAITMAAPVPNKEAAARIKAAYLQEFGGSKQGSVALLDAGADIKQLSFNLHDLEFPELRGIAEARIAAACGVPAALAGLKTGIDRAAEANLDGLRLYFAETTCSDYWRRLEDSFSQQVGAAWGENVVCRFDRHAVRALALQSRTEAQPVADGFAAGAVTVDEYRDKVLDLDPLPDGAGNVLYVPNTVTPTIDPHEDALAPPPPVVVPPALPPGAAPPNPEPTEGKSANPKGSRRQAALLRRVVARAERERRTLARGAEPLIAANLAAQRDAIVAALPGAVKAEIDPDDVLDADDASRHRDDLSGILSDLHAQGLQAGYSATAALVGLTIGFDIESPPTLAATAALGQQIVGIDATTRQAVRDAIRTGVEEGQTIEEMAQALHQSAAFSPSRAQLIARTESGMAYGRGAASAYEELGTTHVLISDGDQWDEPCRKVDGTVQLLSWYKANPLQHPNCSRAAAPVP